MKTKALKVTVSGSYRGAENKIFDYSNVTGVIPFNEEEIATMHVRRRYAPLWVARDERFKENRLYSIRECHIDAMEETTAEFSYLGKDIRLMTQEELQDLATSKDLRLVPLFQKSSEREARTRAYADYSAHFLGKKVKYQEAGFNLMKQPPIIVKDGKAHKDDTRKMTNEEVMDAEAEINNPKTTLSRDEMEELAKKQGISFHPGISDKKLYDRIYAAA